MTREKAKQLARGLFLRTLPHLAVGPKMRRMARYRGGALEIEGDPIPLHEGLPVRVVALGKAAIEMTHTLAEILDGVRLRGVVAAPSLPKYPLPGFEYFAGGHPYPNEQSRLAASAALALLDHKNVTRDDLDIFLISGGGSSLFELPLDQTIFPDDVCRLNKVLVSCGAGIREINTVRKHFSAVKGGRLAQAAWPARQVTLYVSDVPEHTPSMVAAGPSMPDETTMRECNEVIRKYQLEERLPPDFRTAHFETPKPGDARFDRSLYYCLLSNADAVETLAQLGEEAGMVAEVDTRCDDWELPKAADYLLDRLRQLSEENPGKVAAIISGGELSCPFTGGGMGGRNQAFVLYCATRIAGARTVVLSAGTDGIDGNSPAAGAVADGETLTRARSLGLDPAEFERRSDPFHFFDNLGDAIVTGPTGTNVRDLRLLLAFPSLERPQADSSPRPE